MAPGDDRLRPDSARVPARNLRRPSEDLFHGSSHLLDGHPVLLRRELRGLLSKRLGPDLLFLRRCDFLPLIVLGAVMPED